MKVMGQIGGSGKWIGWEVEEFAGRVEWAKKTGKVFTGHVPTRVEDKKAVIARQIKRQDGTSAEHGPKGGHVFQVEV